MKLFLGSIWRVEHTLSRVTFRRSCLQVLLLRAGSLFWLAGLFCTQEQHSGGLGALTQLAAKRREIFTVIPQALFQE